MSRQPASPTSAVIPSPSPAYFLSLTVENYRCFGPAQTLNLSDGAGRHAPWTIILGENGVGKTTLLQCLAALQPVDGAKAGTDKTVIAGRDVDILRATSLLRGYGVTEEKPVTLTYAYHTTGDLLSRQEPDFVHPFSIVVRHNGGSWSGILPDGTAPICYGYGASRRMGKAALSEQRGEDTTASLFSDDVDLVNAEEWLLQADYAASRAKGSGTAAERRGQIENILTDLLPDVEAIRFQEPANGLGAPTVEFQTPYGWVPLKGLSLGYRTLITWMVDLASRLFDRYPDSPNPLAEPAVVLVDEIDLHLHPRWQRTLMRFLSERFPNAQFIATAHSPLVVQAAAEDANLVVLRRDGDHVVIDRDTESIRNWRVDQILTSELFGLDSARPPRTEGLLNEREALLSKPRLTKRDQARLQSLEAQIGTLPTGETPQDREAMDIIRQAAALLQAK